MKFQSAAGPTGYLSTQSNLLERNESSNHKSLTESQKQVDGLVEKFVCQATDLKTLAPIVVGGLAYRLGRMGVMATGGGRLASVGIGLGAEVTTFEMTNRSLSSLTGDAPSNPNMWKWDGSGGIRQGLLSSLITFGTLKGVGHLAQGENVGVQHLLQDTGMVLGHQVSGAFGLIPRPTGTLAEQFLHAEVTNLQLGAGMAWGHAITGGQFHGIERGLDLSLQNTEEVSGDHPRFESLSPALAGNPIQRSAHLTGDEKPFCLPDWLANQNGENDPPTKEREEITLTSKEQADHLRFLAENPQEATLEDVGALIEDIEKNRTFPEKFGPPLNLLMRIHNSLDETKTFDKMIHYLEAWEKRSSLEEIDSLSEAIQRADAREGEFSHLLVLLINIAHDHPSQEAREHAMKRAVEIKRIREENIRVISQVVGQWDPQILWEKIDQAVAKFELPKVKEYVGYLTAIALSRQDENLWEELFNYPHPLVRKEVYKILLEDEDLVDKSRASQSFWKVERKFILEDLGGEDEVRFIMAMDILHLFSHFGVAEAKKILLQVPESWLKAYEEALQMVSGWRRRMDRGDL